MAKDLAEIVYQDPKNWQDGDGYAIYCWFTHALYKAPKYSWYKDKINSIDYQRVSLEVRAIIQKACSEIPGSWDSFSQSAIKIIKGSSTNTSK